jgi:hypothetical protein
MERSVATGTGRLLLLLIATVSVTSPLLAETVVRRDGETGTAFAQRVKPPRSEIVHQVIEAEPWIRGQRVIIAFYEQGVPGDAQSRQVVGHLFLPRSANTYDRTLIHVFEPEGGTPAIEAIFFANADADPEREIVVLCSWPVRHHGVNGTLYGTFVFDAPKVGDAGPQLVLMKELSSRLDGGCECERTDAAGRVSRERAKYKTAAEVRAGLKRLGF